MKNLPNIGLPIILLALLLIVFISRSSVNIGSGEAGVLFKTLGGGVVTDTPPKGEGFKIIAPWNRVVIYNCLLYTSPSPRDRTRSRMPSSA